MPKFDTFIEQFVLCLFLFLIAAVYIWCGRIVLSLKANSWNLRSLRAKSYVGILFGLLGLICFGYSFLEPFQLDMNRVSFGSNKLEGLGRPLKIVHISDLHCDGIKRVVDQIPARVKSCSPDFVVFSGDACHNKKGLRDFRNCLSSLAEICPVYAIKGNHDARGVRYWELFKGTGARELNCSGETILVEEVPIWIGGVAVDNETCLEETLLKAPEKQFKVFLYHYPHGVESASKYGIDLFCAGHTHGGQVRLPMYGALLSASGLGRKYDRGLFEVAGTKLHISQGTGMTGLPIRFLAPPQITLIEVEPGQ